MPKYNPGDDGKTIDGKIVVFVWPPGDAPAVSSSASGAGQPGSAADGTAAAGAKGSGRAAGAPASAGAANGARASLAPDGGLAARNNALQDQNNAAGKQAETLASAAKAAVPFCEKCAAADGDHEPEAPAPA